MLTIQNVLTFQKEVLAKINDPGWTWEEACEMGLAARNLRDLTNWIIGTVAAGIELKWGESQLSEFAKILGFDRKTIEQYRWVVQKFGSGYQPAENLPWSYYRLAAGTQKPQETVAHFIDNNYTYREAQQYARGLPVARECDHDFSEDVLFERCSKCRVLRLKESL